MRGYFAAPSVYMFNVQLKQRGLSCSVLFRGKQLTPRGLQNGGIYFTTNQCCSAEATIHRHHSNSNAAATQSQAAAGNIWLIRTHKLLCRIYLSAFSLCFSFLFCFYPPLLTWPTLHLLFCWLFVPLFFLSPSPSSPSPSLGLIFHVNGAFAGAL